jgi:hypothetical protein
LAIWNWFFGAAGTVGNPPPEAGVNISVVFADGTSVPPEVIVICGRSANSSASTTASRAGQLPEQQQSIVTTRNELLRCHGTPVAFPELPLPGRHSHAFKDDKQGKII